MTCSPLCFSYSQEKYQQNIGIRKKTIHWLKEEGEEKYNWDNCEVSAIKTKDGNFHIIIRRIKIIAGKEEYNLEIPIKLKLMIGFDAKNFEDVSEEEFDDPFESNSNPKPNIGKRRIRRVIHFIMPDKKKSEHPLFNCCIWQWKEEQEKEIQNQKDGHMNLKEVFLMLDKLRNQPFEETNHFNLDTIDKDNSIIPVIYQPEMDRMNNFLRQVHCYPLKKGEVEVTLVFNDEHLQNNSPLDKIYRIYRWFRHGRVRDIESFKILLEEGKPKEFDFKGIYSESSNMSIDNQHADKKIEIKWFYGKDNCNHPIVFVNTANHALADKDNNNELWKFEYTSWENFTPVFSGNLRREEFDSMLGFEGFKDMMKSSWKELMAKKKSK